MVFESIGCQRQIVLACFICKMAFDDRIDRKYYYDNCVYNNIEKGQVQNFEAYNITPKLGMIYVRIKKYSDLLFYNERKRLLTINNTRGP